MFSDENCWDGQGSYFVIAGGSMNIARINCVE